MYQAVGVTEKIVIEKTLQDKDLANSQQSNLYIPINNNQWFGSVNAIAGKPIMQQ